MKENSSSPNYWAMCIFSAVLAQEKYIHLSYQGDSFIYLLIIYFWRFIYILRLYKGTRHRDIFSNILKDLRTELSPEIWRFSKFANSINLQIPRKRLGRSPFIKKIEEKKSRRRSLKHYSWKGWVFADQKFLVI